MRDALIITTVAVLGFVNVFAQDSLTPRQRIDLLPLPEKVVVERDVDLSKDSIIEFSKQHNDFAAVDPFLMERRKGSIPEHIAIRFVTPAQPRDVFLFYKRFFNTESEKTSRERTLPFYNSRSCFSFDQKNEADVTRDKTIGTAVFYRISALGERGQRMDIVIFSDGKTERTTVYIIALEHFTKKCGQWLGSAEGWCKAAWPAAAVFVNTAQGTNGLQRPSPPQDAAIVFGKLL
ncbi:MAG: hypothetical protein WCO68_05265 [Verrucomicrobiota bacterium]